MEPKHPHKNLGVAAHACNPSSRRCEKEDWGCLLSASLGPGSVKDPCLKRRRKRDRTRHTAQHLCMRLHLTHISHANIIHMHTQKVTIIIVDNPENYYQNQIISSSDTGERVYI